MVLGKVGKNVDNSKGSLAKGIKLKESHGSVHNDDSACADGLLLLGGSGRTVVKTPHLFRGGGLGDTLGASWALPKTSSPILMGWF